MTIKEKVNILVNSIANSEISFAKDDLEAVEDFINDCGNYVDKVTAMESAMQVARFRLEGDDYKELIIRLDKNRKLAHDALIASVRLINRLCGVYDVEKLYTGPDERIPIGDFALEVADIYFAERKL